MNIHENMLSLVGNTPLVKLNRIGVDCGATLVAKLESMNPCFSIKDRIAVNMIREAEKDGLVDADTVIVEPTSGNTGIGLAFMCAVRGYKLVLTMPASMSRERKDLLRGFGAELVLVTGPPGMQASIDEAKRIAADLPKAFIPMQFANPANPAIHMQTTAEEIWSDTEGGVDIFVAGVGTGGTISGTGRVLKERKPEVQIVAVEPAESHVLSGGAPGPHPIQGIGAGFVPDVYDPEVPDELFQVKGDEALTMAKRLLTEEGILCGISSGGNCHAALQVASRPENAGKLVVFIVCDTGERYLSTALFQDENN